MAVSKPAPIIGIDLATTRTCVGVCENGKTEVLINGHGQKTTPSFVAFKDTGEILVGLDAKKYSYLYPKRAVYDIKRIIGRPFDDPNLQEDIRKLGWPFEVADDGSNRPVIKVTSGDKQISMSPEDVASLFLWEMKCIAERHLGKKVSQAVVTVPAYFGVIEKEAVIHAGQMAGLDIIHLLKEPTAACYAYSNRMTKVKNVFVFDLGGGTFDVSITNIADDKFKVEAISGDIHLGGVDIDSNIVDFVEKEIKLKNKKFELDALRHRLLFISCEEAKCSLSFSKTAEIMLPDFFGRDKPLEMTLSRHQLETINSYIFTKTVECVDDCLQKAKMSTKDIGDIVLVGGSSRIPKIQENLKGKFRRDLCGRINPDEAVAYGAAIFAAGYKGTLVQEVNPYTFGVMVDQGDMSVILEKNSKLPASMTKTYQPQKDNTDTVNIKVYEGDRRSARSNHYLGVLKLEGLVPGTKNQQTFKVEFTIDLSCLLTVNVTEVNGIKRTSRQFSKDKFQAKSKPKRSAILDAYIKQK